MMEELYTVRLTKNELVFLLRSMQAAMKGWEALNPLSGEELEALSKKINSVETDNAKGQ
jgi:hypothetical protein